MNVRCHEKDIDEKSSAVCPGQVRSQGFEDGTFGINKNCSRGQIVTFLYRIR